jgi:hypothetical protein
MNFLTRLAVAALALALAAIGPALATTYTTQYSPTNGAYISLGSGPLQVSLNSVAGVYLIVADAQPSASALGEPLDLSQPATQPRVFNTTSQVWARAIQSAGATLQVTNGLAGSAATPLSTVDGVRTPLGVYQVSVTTAETLATAIGASIPAGATLVYIEPEIGGADIRYRDDGTAPTNSVGVRISAGVAWPYVGSLSAIQLVSQSGAAATVNLAFYK